jgi:hypothetical protein
VSEASKRGRSFVTLVEAWGGAIVFNRLWAFGPEVELASWGRTLSAIGLAALVTSIWRAVMSLVLYLLVEGGGWNTQVAINALRSVAQTLPPALLVTLSSVPIAVLTWVAARAVGGRQSLKVHWHLTTVASSAWVVLVAVLAPLTILLPYMLGGDTRFDLPFDVVTTFVTIAVSAAGPVWLTQAIRTAQGLPLARAILAALLVAILAAVLFLVLQIITGGGFADLLSKLAVAPFLPLPDIRP